MVLDAVAVDTDRVGVVLGADIVDVLKGIVGGSDVVPGAVCVLAANTVDVPGAVVVSEAGAVAAE